MFPRFQGELHLDDEILTVAEVSKLLKINEKTVYRLVSESKIPGFKVGGSWRFRKDELIEWMNSGASNAKSGGSQ